jgi:hypothetical protein
VTAVRADRAFDQVFSQFVGFIDSMKERGLAPRDSHPRVMLGLFTSTTTKEAPVDEYDGRQYVGIDLHRRRSVIVRMTPEGERLGAAVRIDNDPFELAQQVASWGESPEVVLEATYGWYGAADVLAEAGANVHLAHPLGIMGFSYRRVKNDEIDSADLADLLRMGRLPEAWIAPPEVRGLREEVRHRCKLVALRSGLKAQVHSVLAKQGVRVAVSDLFGVGGTTLLDELALDAPYHARVLSLRRLIDAFTLEIDILAKRTAAQRAHHPGYRAIQAIPGVGPVLAGGCSWPRSAT